MLRATVNTVAGPNSNDQECLVQTRVHCHGADSIFEQGSQDSQRDRPAPVLVQIVQIQLNNICASLILPLKPLINCLAAAMKAAQKPKI